MMLVGRLRRDEGGFALVLVLITSLLMGVVGIGIFSAVMSDLHGAVANQLAMQAVNVAEAGVDYAISELYAKALETPSACLPLDSSDSCWTGPGGPIAFGRGSFQVDARCWDNSVPSATVVSKGCPDNPATADIDEGDVRVITSTGLLAVRPARRQIQVWVRRAPEGGPNVSTFCGRQGVELDQGTTVTADVASNLNIAIEGPRRNPGTIQAKDFFLAAPPDPTGFSPIPLDPGPFALTGTYSWKVTFVDATGAESDGSPPTTAVSLANQNGGLTSVSLGGVGIVKRRIYRTRADQASTGPWYFAGEIADNTTTSYTDTTVDARLILALANPPNPPAPTTAPTAAPDLNAPAQPTGLTGSYTYKVTYVYRYSGSATAEIESVGSSPGTPDPPSLVLTGQYVKLTSIPQNSDPTVLKRRIYRRLEDPNCPNCPWLFVTEITVNNNDLDDLDPDLLTVERGYIDKTADADLFFPEPRAVAGNATAGRTVTCSQGCPNQVDGVVRENVRELLCLPILPPPCLPDADPNNDAPLLITHSDADPLVKTLQYDEVHPAADQRMTIQTPSNPNAQLHIHVNSITFERDVVMAVSGQGRVYFHVAGTFRLGQRSWFGLDDTKPGSLLVWPGDRIQIMSCAIDPSYITTGTASVRWDQLNRVSAVILAPRANILINQAGEFHGALVGQYIHINQGLGYVLDPGSGIDLTDARRPFQIIDRWYDNPRF
jgi:Tfp pilus assembly protein PilX